MSPHLEIRNGKPTYQSRVNEHPELIRGKIGMPLAAALNFIALRERYLQLARESEQKTIKILEKVFPPKIADDIMKTIIQGGNLEIEAIGIFLGDSEHLEDKTLYAFSSKDKRLIPDIAKGLAKQLETLPPDQAMLFLEKYLAWLGDKEQLDNTVELAVSYPNKAVQLPVMVSKNPEDKSITLSISAQFKRKNLQGNDISQPANPFSWLNYRAKVALFGFPSFDIRKHILEQERIFYFASVPFIERPSYETPSNLILIAHKNPEGKGIVIDAGIGEITKPILYGKPTVAQFSSLLARLTHPPDMEPKLGNQLKRKEIELIIDGHKN